jgi:hypothetical protein
MQRTILLISLAVFALIGGVAAARAVGHTAVTVCHKPGTSAEHTIVIDDSALQAHLNHGDYLGPCQDPPGTTTDPGTTTFCDIADSECNPGVVDLCPNIEGVQEDLPDDLMFDEDTGENCVPIPSSPVSGECSERGDSLNGLPICLPEHQPVHIPGENKLAPHKLFVAGQKHHCGWGSVWVKGHCATPGLW